MNWLDRLERRFGGWEIPNFALFLVLSNGLIYVLGQIRPDFLLQLMLDPEAIRHGQLWRLITFVFVPPLMSPFWMMFWLLVLYQFAQALEQEWGDFRFFVFYVIGALATIIAAFCVGEPLFSVQLNTTLFLAFATLFPEFELLLFFILPVKVKYLAILPVIWMVFTLLAGSAPDRAATIGALVSYGLFFGPQIWQAIRLRMRWF